jgi:hypothetical protein
LIGALNGGYDSPIRFSSFWSIGVLELTKTKAGYLLKAISCADYKKPY